jgi:Flp pilus assembly protein TadD
LRSALKANPGDPMLSINLGLSLVLGGNAREGANVLLDVTRYPDAPPQARQDLALAYGMLGNVDAAAEILSKDLPKASVDDNLRFYATQRVAGRQPATGPAPARGGQTLSARSATLP